jgi:zinc transporter ZupT
VSQSGFSCLNLAVASPLVSGDFCTLVRAGYSTNQAILAQLFTAVAAFIGTATAIAISADSRMEEPIILFTTGGFIYLAGTTILPEVLNEEDHGHHESKHSGGLLRFAKLIAFCVGILFLSMVDWLNDDDHHHHSAAGHVHEHANVFQEGAAIPELQHRNTEL